MRAQRSRGAGVGQVFAAGRVLEVQQAAGRLIRTSTDRGVLVLADSRLLSKGYGKKFLASLPTGYQQIAAGQVGRLPPYVALVSRVTMLTGEAACVCEEPLSSCRRGCRAPPRAAGEGRIRWKSQISRCHGDAQFDASVVEEPESVRVPASRRVKRERNRWRG